MTAGQEQQEKTGLRTVSLISAQVPDMCLADT